LVAKPSLAVLLAIVAASIAWIAVSRAPAVERDGLAGMFARDSSMMAWPVVLVMAPLLAAVLSRRAELSARGGVLTVRWAHLLFARCRAWRREDLADLRAVSERVTSDGNKAWSQHLAIRPHDFAAPAPRHLLYWCEKAELEWIATTLRRALTLPATPPKPNPATDGWDDEVA
jgi:hypothetical protein